MKLKRRKLRLFLSSRWLYLTYYSKQKARCSFVAYFYKLIFFCQKHALNGWRLKFTCKIDSAWQWFRVVCLYNQNKRRRGDLKFWLKALIRRRFLNWQLVRNCEQLKWHEHIKTNEYSFWTSICEFLWYFTSTAPFSEIVTYH